MPGIVQELDLILNQAQLGKTVQDAQRAGADIGNAIGNAPAVKDAAHKLGEAISVEMKKVTASAKMDMAALASASSPVTTAFTQTTTATVTLGRESRNTHELVNHLRGGLTSLASEAANVPGPIGQIASRLLAFSAGGVVTLGVVAGIGLIVLAWNKLTEATRKAHEETQKYIDKITELNKSNRTPFAQFTDNVKEAQEQIAKLTADFAKIQAGHTIAGDQGMVAGTTLSPKQQEILKEIEKVQIHLNDLIRIQNGLEQDAAATQEEEITKSVAGHTRVSKAIQQRITYASSLLNIGVQLAANSAAQAAADATAAEKEATVQAGLAKDREAMMGQLRKQLAATTATSADDLELELHDLQTKIIETFGAVPAEVQPLLDDYRKRIAAAKEETGKSSPVVQKLGTDWKKVGDTVATVGQGILDIAHGLGLVNENMDKVAQGAISMGKNLAGALSGDPTSIVGFVGGAISFVGGFVHKSKDPERLRTNDQMYQRAMTGDKDALEFLRTHSVVSQNGSVGWGSEAAAEDARAKYMEAKAVQDATAKPAQDAANAQHGAEIAAMNKQSALNQQRANEEAQVRGTQSDEAAAHRNQVMNAAQKLGFGRTAAQTNALFQAAAIAGQGALGHDSPLYVEAERKAEDALRDLERQVEQAQKQQADAKTAKADAAGGIQAGFTVQRTLTESSAGRIVGELTTQSMYLKDIRDAVVGRPGSAIAGAGLTPDVHVHLDGQVIAKVVGKHQHAKLQQAQAMTGNSNMT